MSKVPKYKREEKTKKGKRDYVNKEEFYEELKLYQKQLKKAQEEGKPEPLPSDKIGFYIMEIVDKVLKSHRFNGYTDLWKDEMRSDAILANVKSIKNFNVDKYKNPFAYFTTATWYVFYNVINREKRYNDTATSYNTESHNDYINVGADGFIYNVPEHIHDKIANTDIDWGFGSE